jgi:Ice-binding-like
MSLERKGRGGYPVIILVSIALLFATLAVAVPSAGGTPSPARGGFGASSAAAACGQEPVPLASASGYAILASSTVTSTGATAVTGNLGLSPGTSVTGFPPATITGIQNITTPQAAGAEANLTIAYNNASARSNCAVSVAGNIGGQTLTPGLYKSTSSLAISSGDLTLSGGGNPNGVFVFQVASALTTTSGRTVILTDGAQAGNVFWQIGSSATLGTTSVMQGTVMAHDSISMLTGSVLHGRALAETGEVSLAASTITVPTTGTTSTYEVTVTETGLPATTNWDVELGGVLGASLASTMTFTVGAGTYDYLVTTVAGFVATPSSGSVTVGAAATLSITFQTGTSALYPTSFVESGLVSGTTWAVTLNGVLKSSATADASFAMPNGTYGYVTGTATGYNATPSAGTLTVEGRASTIAVAFSPAGGPETFNVTFSESGLALGTAWSMTLNGVRENSTTTTIVFTELNGTTHYTVGTSSGYSVTPSSGNVSVAGTTVGQALTFSSMAGDSTAAATSSWVWTVIAVVVLLAVAGLAAGILLARRKKTAP